MTMDSSDTKYYTSSFEGSVVALLQAANANIEAATRTTRRMLINFFIVILLLFFIFLPSILLQKKEIMSIVFFLFDINLRNVQFLSVGIRFISIFAPIPINIPATVPVIARIIM